jgi:hypothetical protein
MLKLKNKKGIETKMLIGLLLLLVGFGIVVMLYYRVNFPSVVDKQVCTESVNLRGIASGVAGSIGESFVALKCKTEKVCITSGLVGGTCEENFGKESVVQAKIKNSALGINQSAKVISDKVLSCWDMMGQGRLSLFSSGWKAQFGLGKNIYSSCVICSRIAFDMKNTANVDKTQVNVYDYMIRHKVPGKEFTYAGYIAEGSPAGISITNTASILGNQKFIDNVLNILEQGQENVSEVSQPAEFSNDITLTKSPEIAVIFMQFSAPDYKTVILNTFGVVGASFVLPGVGTVAKKATGLIFSNPWTGIPAAIGVATFAGYQSWNVYKGYDAAVGYCGDVTIGGSSKPNYGCSAIRVIPYDAENIKHFCGAIESIS